MLRSTRFLGAHAVVLAMALQTELRNIAGPQQSRIRRAVRRMTGNTTFGFHGRVFKRERPLLIRVTLDAGCIRTGRQSRLLEFKAAVRVVAISALHRPFENLMMERLIELVLNFAVATDAQLRLAYLQHFQG